MTASPDSPRNGNGMTLTGIWGTLRVHGRDVVLILLLVVGFYSVVTILRDGFATLSLATNGRMAEHQKLLDAQNELGCVLMMSQDARVDSLSDPQGICHYVRTFYRFATPPRKP